MGSPGIHVVSFLPAQVNVTSSVAVVSTGLIFSNYGNLRQFRLKAFLRVQQSGAGGFRWQFTGLVTTIQGLRQTFDVDALAMAFVGLTNGSAQMTFTPTGAAIDFITLDFSGQFSGSITQLELKFAQQTSDPGQSSLLLGSFIDLFVI